MGSICLSSASILRCDPLTRNQNIYLIIPTALEVIFSTSLVFIDQGPAKRNLLLTAEGLSFLTLVLIELFSNILPAVRGNPHLFEAFGLAIGVASILPIFLYTIFLYLLMLTETVSSVPRRFGYIIRLAPLFFILAIIVSNEIAAFTSSSIGNIPTGKALTTITALESFRSTSQEIWTISTSLTLTLLSGFQAAIFCLAFFRLMQTIFHHRIEGQASDKALLIKGIRWISGSLMLGAIETGIGFAVGGFEVVLTRRILRLVARVSLCIGVVKGVPAGTMFGQSQLGDFISNPRFSTFHHLSPKATSFHAAQQMQSEMREKSATDMTPRAGGLPGMAYFADIRAQNGHQRVSVRYHRGRPLLHLRLSAVEVPSLPAPVKIPQSELGRRPEIIVEEVESRPQSGCDLSPPRPNFHQPSKSAFRDSTDSTPSFYAPAELVSAPRRTLSQRSARAQLYQAVLPAASRESLYPDSTIAVNPSSMQSTKSIPESLQAVQDLAGQFPGTPTTFADQNGPPIPQALGSPSQLRYQGQLWHDGNIVISDDGEWSSSNRSSPAPSFDNRSTQSGSRRTLYTVTGTPLRSGPLYPEKSLDSLNDDDDVSPSIVPRSKPVNGLQDGDLATALDSGESRQYKPRKPRSPRPISKRDIPPSKNPRKSTTLPRHASPRRGNPGHIIIPSRPSNMPEILDE